MASDEEQNDIDRLQGLTPDRCPECGYSLVGLPSDGACPECGARYGSEIVVYAWNVGADMSLADSTFDHPRHNVFIIGAILMIPIAIYYPPVVVLLAAYAVRVGYQLYQRRRVLAVTPAPVQLRLSAKSYSIRPGCGPAKPRSWRRVHSLLLEEVAGGKHHLAIYEQVYVGPLLKRDPSTELEMVISPEVVRYIASLRAGPLSHAVCNIRSSST